MNPADALYTVFIWPVHFVIEFLFLALKEIFAGNMGLVIIFTGIIVNTLLLPLYNVAEEWQNGERSTQKRMKPVLSRIRRFYRGDERQMLIAAYYKQARYSPLNMLRSTSGFLLQIPFFIAAYQFLSHTSSLRGHSFLFIKDLGAPDGIFAAPLFTVNVLPLIMTVFNLLSAAFYIRGFSIREKIQLFSMPAIFLVLLYNFPSGMVLYWTVNNMFSLGKNLTIRFSRNPSRFLYYLYAGCLLLVIFVLAAGLTGINRYRTILIFVCVFSLFIPLLAGKIFRFLQFLSLDNRELKWFFFAPLLLLTLVTGVIAPVQLISSSSPEDFSRPVSFLSRTFLQSCAFFLFLPLILWLFSSRRVKYILAPLSVFLGITGTLCYFFFSTLYGTMTRSFKFENTHHILDAYTLPFNLVLFIPGVLFVLFILFYKNKKRVAVALQALVFGFFLFGAYSFFVFITNHDKPYAGQAAPGGVQSNGPEGFFRLSSTGNNVFYLFLDRASGVAFYDVLEFLPELREKLDGFTFYPNTLSFANYTVSGLSAVFGGYEYAPSEINKRADKSLEEAINEGFSILPSTGGETGKKVFILNPPIADSRSVPAVVFFNQFNNVTSIDLNEYFTGRYKRAFPQGEENFFESFDYDIIFRYGLFRTAPPLFRYAIYYNGKWWRDGDSSSYEKTLPEISALHYLSEMCAVDTLGGGEEEGTMCIMLNELTHEDAPFNSLLELTAGSVEYGPDEGKRVKDPGQLPYLYTYSAGFSELCRFFDFLKTNNVYDNTKIIIVADHGKEYKNAYFDENGMERFNPLLLIKERNERGSLRISDKFMTNADAPIEALSETGGLESGANRRLARPVLFDGYEIIACDTFGNLKANYNDRFKIRKSRKLIYPDIFKSSSWENWKEGN